MRFLVSVVPNVMGSGFPGGDQLAIRVSNRQTKATMSETVDIDLRRVILQSLESWQAAGMTHLAAVPVVVAAPLPQVNSDPGPVATDAPNSVPSPSQSLTETEPDMAKKLAKSKPKDWFDQADLAVAEPKGPPARNLSREDRIAELKILSEKVAKCTRCSELASTRTQTVFGVGNPQARVVFIGEAPGADEDAQGEPFVGRAGQLLNKIIEAMKLKREEIYICNILRCRPPGNRLPAPEEAGHCREFLDGQLGIINPEYIVCWGSCAAQNLLAMTDSIGKMRGRFFQYGRAKVLCTYHPSYLLRNPAAKKDVWDDMKILMKEMGIPID